MMKRNEGYALSYVLVVLLVLALIAVSVLSPPLRNLQNQQASIARMQEKYSAQGKVEQVVAQLECSTGTTIDAVITSIAIPSDTTCTKDSENELTIFVTCEGTTITAEVILEKHPAKRLVLAISG